MIMSRNNIQPEETPKGKRSIRRTIWGNTNGYVSGKFWKTFGPTYSVGVEEDAEAWLNEGKEDA